MFASGVRIAFIDDVGAAEVFDDVGATDAFDDVGAACRAPTEDPAKSVWPDPHGPGHTVLLL